MKPHKLDNFLACYFETLLVRYGKITRTGKYKIELLLPLDKYLGYSVLPIYFSKRKPIYRDLYVIGFFWLPVYCLLCVCIPILLIVVLLFTVLFSFYMSCLFHKSFITETYEKVSGYISLILSIIGLVSVVKLFF